MHEGPPSPPPSPEQPQPSQPPRRLTPEERYLARKRAELAELESLLTERELELHTLRGGLMAFEQQYEQQVGSRYAILYELRARIAELAPPPAESSPESM